MGNKCIGEVDIFAAKDGIYVSDPSCYVVGSDVVKYSKKSTTIDGVTTVTYIDEAGVETASLPVGAEQIDCSKVVFVGNSTGGGSTIPTVQDCDGNDAVPVHDTCAIEILRKIEAGLQSAPSDTALLEGITRIEALLQTIAANTVPVVKNIVQLSTVIQSLDNGISDFVDVTMALDSTKEYSLNVIGYELFPLVQTSVNRQDSTTVRVVVENQSGNVIPATTILITATSLN